jgi:hypothetical protein
MEATSVYWRPVWAVLEGCFEQMLARIIREKWNDDRFLVAAKHDCDMGRIMFDRMGDLKAVRRI